MRKMTTFLSIVQPQSVSTRADAFALLDDFVADLQQRVRAGEIAEATRVTYKHGVDRFIDFAASRKQIDGNVIRDWVTALRDEHHAPASINAWLSGVRAFFRWAEAERGIPYNPVKGVRGAKRTGTKTKHKRDSLSDSEVVRVLDVQGDDPESIRNRAYLHLRAYTACRDIELHRADVAHVRTHGKKTVLYVQGKGHAEADDYVVITPKAEHALRDWLAVRESTLHAAKRPVDGPLFISFSNRTFGKRLSLRAIRWLVKRAFRAAGIVEPTKTSHSLRHTAISKAVDNGAPIQKAQSMARHESIETTAIYYHEKDRDEHPAEEFIKYEDDK